MSLFGAQSEEDPQLEFDTEAFWGDLEDLLSSDTKSKPYSLLFDDLPSDLSGTKAECPQPVIHQYSLTTQLSIDSNKRLSNEVAINTTPLKIEEQFSYTHEIPKPEPVFKRQKYSYPISKKTEILKESEESIQQEINFLKEKIQKHNDESENASKNISDKKECRRIRNKFTAAISRANKEIKSLEARKQILLLENRIHALEEENKCLKIENATLKAQESAPKTLEFTTHTALRLSQESSSGQQVVITTRHELQASPKRKVYKY
ncbi:MAG: bZIP transcription factor [Candidatus Berkiella sp.]